MVENDEEKASGASTPIEKDMAIEPHPTTAAPNAADVSLDDSELAINWTNRRKTITFALVWVFTLIRYGLSWVTITLNNHADLL
jgi:hypothetical protein